MALDGKRTDTFEQYVLVRGLTEDPSMRIIVYHDGAYKEVKCMVPQRMFNLDFGTYAGN